MDDNDRAPCLEDASHSKKHDQINGTLPYMSAVEDRMKKTAQQHSANFKNHKGNVAPIDSKRRVLLTGSTGALGAFILDALVKDKSIAQIYCINRPGKNGSSTLFDRQKASLLDKGLPTGIMASYRVCFLEACLHREKFGLEDVIYKEMQRSVTHIIHNAWPVNLNFPLEFFDDSLSGLRNLVDFALGSPLYTAPAIIFTSSTFVFLNLSLFVTELPEQSIPPGAAAGAGYAESKWVAEQVLGAASIETGLTTVIVRIGQLCGGPNGIWKSREWLPALVQSAHVVGCLPRRSDNVSWLPLDVAARGLVDYLNCSKSTILHLVHPKPVPWSCLAERLSSVLRVPLVQYEHWLQMVEVRQREIKITDSEQHRRSRTTMSAGRFCSFYRAIDDNVRARERRHLVDAFGLASVSVVRGVAESPTLAAAIQLGPANVDAWLKYWKNIGFIASPGAKL